MEPPQSRAKAAALRRSPHRRIRTAADHLAMVGWLATVGALIPASLGATGMLSQDMSGRVGQDRPPAVALKRELLDSASLDSIVRPVMIDWMANRFVAGAAISVVHDGQLVYRAGFRDREVYHEVPVDPERTIFRIGSVTKIVTGIAVMQLVDEGLLDLEADVNEYLTAFRVPDAFDEPVRVRHLLTHTAGFDQIGTGRHAMSAGEVRPLGDFLSENLIRIRPPEEVSSYDTYAITLAGHLVEQVSGMSYETYLRTRIFEPLGMQRSGITVPDSLRDDVAVGYEFRGEWFPQRWEYMNTDPASTVNSTVTDMARLMMMMLGEGEVDGVRILSEASAVAMLRPQWRNHPDQPGYGYTFWEDRTFDVSAFSHGGSMTGFGSFLYLVPEHDLGIYVQYNQESGGLANAAVAAILDAVLPGRAPPPPRERLASPPDLSRFAGTYANNMHHHTDPNRGWRRRPFEIGITEDGGLDYQGTTAYAVGALAFQREDGLLLTFRENERGEITHLFVRQEVFERLP